MVASGCSLRDGQLVVQRGDLNPERSVAPEA